MGWFQSDTRMKTWRQGLLIFGITILFLIYSPTLLDLKPKAFSLTSLPLTGPLEINNKLSKAEHLVQGDIVGPESVVIHKGDIITGTADGKIVKVNGNKVIPLAQIGRDCDMPYEERLCGRPLGLRMWKDGLLYILDGYYGLHSMNLSTGLLSRLLSTNVNIEGQKIIFPDDLDIDDNGNVYFSDGSSKWDLSSLFYMILEHQGNGRVIKYNIHNGKTEVILRNLYFPNGIQISKDGSSLLICEIMTQRILRYHLNGPKKGQLEVFADNLPGEPDNIRLSSYGTYWVAFYSARSRQSFANLFENLSQYPLIRGFVARTVHGFGSVLMALSDLSSSHAFKEFAYKFRRGDFLMALHPRYGMVIEFDKDGNILRSLQAPDGSISSLSQVTEHDGYLYLGSVQNKYIGRLKL